MLICLICLQKQDIDSHRDFDRFFYIFLIIKMTTSDLLLICLYFHHNDHIDFWQQLGYLLLSFYYDGGFLTVKLSISLFHLIHPQHDIKHLYVRVLLHKGIFAILRLSHMCHFVYYEQQLEDLKDHVIE